MLTAFPLLQIDDLSFVCHIAWWLNHMIPLFASVALYEGNRCFILTKGQYCGALMISRKGYALQMTLFWVNMWLKTGQTGWWGSSMFISRCLGETFPNSTLNKWVNNCWQRRKLVVVSAVVFSSEFAYQSFQYQFSDILMYVGTGELTFLLSHRTPFTNMD